MRECVCPSVHVRGRGMRDKGWAMSVRGEAGREGGSEGGRWGQEGAELRGERKGATEEKDRRQ